MALQFIGITLAVPLALVWIIRKGAWWGRHEEEKPPTGYRARRPC